MRYILFVLFVFFFADAFCQNQKLLLKIETTIKLQDELKCLSRLKELNHDIYLGSLCWISYPEDLERKINLKKLLDMSYPELRTKTTKGISNKTMRIELDSVFSFIDQAVKFSEENMFLLKAITDYSDNFKMETANSVIKERIFPQVIKVDNLLNKIIFQEELKLSALLDEM